MPPVPKCVTGTSDWVCQSLKLKFDCDKHFCALWTIAHHLLPPLPTFKWPPKWCFYAVPAFQGESVTSMEGGILGQLSDFEISKFLFNYCAVCGSSLA